MNYTTSDQPIIEQSIHDESNSSVGDDSNVFEQLKLSESFETKVLILKTLLQNFQPSMSTTFRALIQTSKQSDEVSKAKESKFEMTAYTKDGSSLVITLTKYPKRTYLGVRFSPTKLDSGQNLLELTDSKGMNTLSSKFGVSKFAARSLEGFRLIKNLVRDVFLVRTEESREQLESFRGDLEAKNRLIKSQFYFSNTKLFTADEAEKLKRVEVGVYSVGYATYVDFGENRNENLHLLGYLATATVSFEKFHFPLAQYLGITAKTWQPEDEDGEIQGITGLLLQKKKHKQTHCQQLYYLKDEEVEAKKDSSGRKNMLMMNSLSAHEKNQLKNNLVRVDNTFFSSSMKEWISWSTGEEDRNPEFRKDKLEFHDVDHLFSNKEILKTMIASTTTELGVRTLLKSPTLERIEELISTVTPGLSDHERSRLDLWRSVDPIYSKGKKKNSVKISYRSPINSNGSSRQKEDRDLIMKMYENEFLDISLPYGFFVFLNEVRSYFFLTFEERMHLAMFTIGFKGKRSNEQAIPEIQERMRNHVVSSIHLLRENLKTLPSNKGSSEMIELGRKLTIEYKATKEDKDLALSLNALDGV